VVEAAAAAVVALWQIVGQVMMMPDHDNDHRSHLHPPGALVQLSEWEWECLQDRHYCCGLLALASLLDPNSTVSAVIQ
jgi:hypothetical protein